MDIPIFSLLIPRITLSLSLPATYLPVCFLSLQNEVLSSVKGRKFRIIGGALGSLVEFTLRLHTFLSV